MAVASIDELCKGYCEIAGLQAPELEVDEFGVKSFTVFVREVPVIVAQFAEARPDDVSVLAEICDVPAQAERRILPLLLELNFQMMGPASPSFSCNLEGKLFAQTTIPLIELSPPELFETVEEMATGALAWRDRIAGKSAVPGWTGYLSGVGDAQGARQ